MTVADYQAKDHTFKTASYSFLFDDIVEPINTAFLMPSSDCRDVRFLLDEGIITTNTHLYVLERDEIAHFQMMQNLKSLGFIRGKNLTDECCDLYEFKSLPKSLDLIFVDLEQEHILSRDVGSLYA